MLSLSSLGMLKQTTFLLPKHGAKVLACSAQQGLKLGRVLVPPRIKSHDALHRAHTICCKRNRKCLTSFSSCPCQVVQMGYSFQTHAGIPPVPGLLWTVIYDVFIIIYILINNIHSSTTREELPEGIEYTDVRFHCPF